MKYAFAVVYCYYSPFDFLRCLFLWFPQVGLLDIDICGPSQPRMLGAADEKVHSSGTGWSPVVSITEPTYECRIMAGRLYCSCFIVLLIIISFRLQTGLDLYW